MECQPLGGVGEFASSAVSVQAFLAFLAVFLAAIQGVVALESVDPCRLSRRKMNILLFVEFCEVVASIASEVLSFVELRSALQERLKWLYWVPPCLLAAGILETVIDLYFTLAVISKSRITWIPFSAIGSSTSSWEIGPFLLTTILSVVLVGWRLRWWWHGCSVDQSLAMEAASKETSLKLGVMGYAVGWAVGVTALVLIVLILTDFAEDGVHYIAGLRYLWRPDEWLPEQHADVKVWYRDVQKDTVMQEYVATATLDASVETANSIEDVETLLQQKPLHCGNAIVGQDAEKCSAEDPAPSRLHKIILLAEHIVALPLLVVVVVIVSRLHTQLDEETFSALQQLADSVIILAFLEVAIGVKNVLWSVSGTASSERIQACGPARIQELTVFSKEYIASHNLEIGPIDGDIKIVPIS